jgi:hypothetical protein
MQNAPNLILIGGNTRHIGKTTLACGIIRSFSAYEKITALKVTSIYKNDETHHGEHELLKGKNFSINPEAHSENPKDTSKMLMAGATESYYIQAMDHAVEVAWQEFLKIVPSNHLMVCESRSLRRIVKPGLFIYLKSSKVKEEKPYSLWLEGLADIVLVDPNQSDLAKLIRQIRITERIWQI